VHLVGFIIRIFIVSFVLKDSVSGACSALIFSSNTNILKPLCPLAGDFEVSVSGACSAVIFSSNTNILKPLCPLAGDFEVSCPSII